MGEPTPAEDHEPGLSAVELLCERLGEIGMPIGAATAREILRAVLALEAPRMEAHIREALQTSLDTIRIAAQSASQAPRRSIPDPSRRDPSSQCWTRPRGGPPRRPRQGRGAVGGRSSGTQTPILRTAWTARSAPCSGARAGAEGRAGHPERSEGSGRWYE